MLAYFPVPYDDELLYSVIARYAAHTGQADNQKAVLRDVFGSSSTVAVPDLPSHLSALKRNVGQIWRISPKKIIKKHTVAPIYLPFLRPLQAEQVVSSMMSNQGGDIHTRCGLAATSVPQPQYFRYCPSCFLEQMYILGEPFWQRIHQLPGIDTCLKHRCELLVTPLSFHPKQKHLYQAAAASCTERKPVFLEISDIEHRLAVRYRELMNTMLLRGYSPHQWTLFYRDTATLAGLIKGSRVDHVGMHELLLTDWRHTANHHLLKSADHSDWLTNIFRKHRKAFHPLRHLMVWCSLLPDVSVEAVFKLIEKLPRDDPAESSTAGYSSCVSCDPLAQVKRKAWLDLLSQKPGCGIKELRSTSQGGALYAWLYRNERCWLTENSPPRIRNNKDHYTADYALWDRDNVSLLKKLKPSLGEAHRRPRMSKTYLIKHLPRSKSVEKHLSDLLNTSQWLEQNSESVEDYRIFRIRRAVNILRTRNMQIKKWRLLRLAGIQSADVTPSLDRIIVNFESRRIVD